MSNLMLFRTVTLRAIQRLIRLSGDQNIKLPVTFRRESSFLISYHFFEIDKMKCLQTCSRNLPKTGGGGGGGGNFSVG